jgi:DNA polymerase-3 subunit gamma/tau
MSYQVLARKWRPRRFSEMVGQAHVVRALNNALERDQLHHAYLFTGTRGVGKTTLARIFSKSLNCERGVTAEPCGECSSCREIDEGRFVDLLEVDAASRTKVDQTRELLENVPYAPVRGRYKVYLIDEVHMFSTSSFNALLKTLEEPPPHVKFLLATTDPQKVPVTVLSRCLQFNLKRLLPEQILGQLQHILEQEEVANEPAALRLLAQAADGSMRDGLSLLDQAIAFGGGRVGEAEVRAMLGTMTRDLILDFVEALSRRDGAALLDLVERMVEHTPDFSGVLAELLAVFHRLAVGQVVPRSLEAAAEPRMDALVDAMTPEDLQLYYQIGLVGRRDLDLAPDPRTGFEMVLLRMLAFRPDMEGEGGKPKPAPEYRPAPPSAVREPAPEPMVPPKQAAPPPVAAGPMQLANGEDWHALAAALPLHALSKQLADNCEFESWDGRVLQLRLDPGCSGIRVGAAEQKLIRALQGRLGEQVQVQIREASPRSETPAQREQRQRDERQRQAEVAVEGDPLVQALQETFDASLVPGSVRPINEN